MRKPSRKPANQAKAPSVKKVQGLLVIIVLLVAVAVHAKTASEVFDAVFSSIVVIRTYDATGKSRMFGSGVALTSEVIATNCHVIEDAPKIQVVHRGKEYPATLRHSDWDRDICTLIVSGLNAPAVTTGSTARLKVGARVYAIGAPQGLELTLSEGIISSLRPVEGGQYLQITAPISPGSSGGGLFDEDGRLIGLPSFYLAQGQQLNFAVPVEWINELPKRHTKKMATAQTTIDLIKKASALNKNRDWSGLLTHSLRWTEARPEDASAWSSLGYAYEKSGQPAKAIEAYQQALRFLPEGVSGEYLPYRLGIAYGQSGQSAEAIESFQQALRFNPEYADAWYRLGLVYIKSGLNAKAIEAFQQALHVTPDNTHAWFPADTWLALGMAYGLTGEIDKQIGAYQQALQINPENADAWYFLGIAYKTSGQTAKVIEVYKRLKTLDPAKADEFFNRIGVP
jgi:S1-C subfamily serine protease/Tfp pilus assembly protein PilF